MQIELKNIKIGFGSEDTLNYEAHIYVDGVRTAYAHNTGRGGMTSITALSIKLMPTLQKAEEFAATLKDVEYSEVANAERYHTLESLSDRMADEYDFNQKVYKIQKKSIVYGNPKTGAINTISWKGKSIAQVLADPIGREKVKDTVRHIFSKLKADEKIMNTNLGNLLTELNPNS